MQFVAILLLTYICSCGGTLLSTSTKGQGLHLDIKNPNIANVTVLHGSLDDLHQVKMRPYHGYYFDKVTESYRYIWIESEGKIATDVNLYYKDGHCKLLSVLVENANRKSLMFYERVLGRWASIKEMDFKNRLSLINILHKGSAIPEEFETQNRVATTEVDISNKLNSDTHLIECSGSGIDSANYITKNNVYIYKLVDGPITVWMGRPDERCHSFQILSQHYGYKLVIIGLLFEGRIFYKYYVKRYTGVDQILPSEFGRKIMENFGIKLQEVSIELKRVTYSAPQSLRGKDSEDVENLEAVNPLYNEELETSGTSVPISEEFEEQFASLEALGNPYTNTEVYDGLDYEPLLETIPEVDEESFAPPEGHSTPEPKAKNETYVLEDVLSLDESQPKDETPEPHASDEYVLEDTVIVSDSPVEQTVHGLNRKGMTEASGPSETTSQDKKPEPNTAAARKPNGTDSFTTSSILALLFACGMLTL